MERLSAKRVALTCVTTAVTALNLAGITPAFAQTYSEPALTNATSTTSYGATSGYERPVASMTSLSTAQKIALLQQKVKYVFVIFQENRSFDHYFGTYPGVNGLTSTYPGANPSDPLAQPANQTSSYNSVIANVDGSYSTISPWLEARTIVNQAGNTVYLYPEDILSVDHSHTGYVADLARDHRDRIRGRRADGGLVHVVEQREAVGELPQERNRVAIEMRHHDLAFLLGLQRRRRGRR